jgi:hypothetical protein
MQIYEVIRQISFHTHRRSSNITFISFPNRVNVYRVYLYGYYKISDDIHGIPFLLIPLSSPTTISYYSLAPFYNLNFIPFKLVDIFGENPVNTYHCIMI